MRSKILIKWPLLVIIVATIASYSYIEFSGRIIVPSQPALPERQAGSSVNTKLSLRLKIPKINIDAAVETVGVTTTGAMDVPKNPANVAWYNQGPLPGDIGSAVIDGHYGPWKSGEISVFNNLNKLNIGDNLSIYDEKGITSNFIVKKIKKYKPDAETSDIFISNDGKSHLNLITCNGIWDEVSKSYSHRLVIFTDKV
ncbi:MAG: class F sortase [Candidatus Paceibacterota bacterium]|jgi:LPXTG-site transpeptidase (sortase) family protein